MHFGKVKKLNGFTLVELLVVVIILAVLASIVVPQFSGSTDDAKVAALNSTLSGVRNAIELYYHQHSNIYPGFNTDGTNGANNSTSFINQLTLYSSAAGVTNNLKTAVYKYGPYLKKTTFPSNPISTASPANAVLMNTGATLGELDASGTDAGGWWFDSTSGKFMANDAGYYTN